VRPYLSLTIFAAACAVFTALIATAHAGEAKIAVAANFTEAAKEIGEAFEQETGHTAVFSFGSTGQLYAQITQGAPFEVFLAADQERPQKTLYEGYAVPGSLFTYAVGRIALYSADETLGTGETTLRTGGFRKLAIANPVTAPYGAAAVETMKALGVYDALETKIVQGSNIAQTYQFVATGNAELGFVALSQIASHGDGSRWLVPQALYAPIAQDAVLLKTGEGADAAEAFVSFLQSQKARAIIERYGYGVSAGEE
jgi:molybdate transport system substrate-binding protein